MEGSLEACQGKPWVSPKDPDVLWWGTHSGLMWGSGRPNSFLFAIQGLGVAQVERRHSSGSQTPILRFPH